MLHDAHPAQAKKGPLPPHARLLGLLEENERLRLLDWAISQQPAFQVASVFGGEGGQQSRIDPDVRVALKHYGLGPFEPILTNALMDRFPEIAAAAGYDGPPLTSIEYELNAYGDGAHFAPHIDIPVGEGRRTIGKAPGEDRVISGVYYFHREPKRFSGGALRLYPFGADARDGTAATVAFEPAQNSLLVFPSWALHAVERVSCPSGWFEDFRFALNCWFCRRLAG